MGDRKQKARLGRNHQVGRAEHVEFLYVSVASNQGDLWMAVDGLVANLTDFATSHPGGVDLLLQHAGKASCGDTMFIIKQYNSHKIWLDRSS